MLIRYLFTPWHGCIRSKAQILMYMHIIYLYIYLHSKYMLGAYLMYLYIYLIWNECVPLSVCLSHELEAFSGIYILLV